MHPVVFKPLQARTRKAKVPLRRESPDSADDRENEIASLCYKSSEVAVKSLEVARRIQNAFITSYLDRVGEVRVTRENLAESLFSIVQFKDKEQEQDGE